MKITDVELIPVSTPLVKAFHMPGTEITHIHSIVLRITTDTGHVGIGEVESFPAAIQALIHAPDAHNHARGLAGVLLGRDPNEST
ncbi:MAG TPA: hypothetical protein VKZ73_09855, partial [Microbacterium sp.]|nr:hypothetical protein [Microbacterium sp.]